MPSDNWVAAIMATSSLDGMAPSSFMAPLQKETGAMHPV
jgi:hypothetical protein